MTRSAMSGGPMGPMDGAFQLPNIGSQMAGNGLPFKGFLDTSIVWQKLRKNLHS